MIASRSVRPLVSALLAMALSSIVAMGAEDEQRDPVYVDSTEILYLESYPVQVVLQVGGALPTPCHEPAWEVTQSESSVDVTLWSATDPELLCAAVLEPVQLSVPLGSYTSADLDVTLNGESAGRIELDDGSSSAGPGLTGAGWSFGMCLGYCRADLRIDGTALTQTGHDREAEAALYENHGELTEQGMALIDSAIAALDGETLKETYGCPDCADGGAAYLTISDGEGESRHDMEFGAPPDELAELYELSTSVMTALESCTSDELVTAAEDCVAYQR